MRKQPKYPQVTYSWGEGKKGMVATMRTKVAEFSFNCTKHLQHRAAQRGLAYDRMLKVIEYGEAVFKQGLTFYTVTKRAFPAYARPDDLERLNNWVVVVKDSVVITCYRAKNGIRHIRRKSAVLVR